MIPSNESLKSGAYIIEDLNGNKKLMDLKHIHRPQFFNQRSIKEQLKKEKKILKDYGWCQIHTIDQDYYMSFDVGHFVVGMKTYPISEMQAIEAMDDELTAERIAMEISRDDSQSV